MALRTLAGLTLVAIALGSRATAQGPNRLRPEHRAELTEFQPQIDAAIDKGVRFLLATQLRDGSWGYEQRHFAGGQTALCAYTLMKAGLPTTHSAVQRALTFVRSAPAEMVYSIGCQLMALAEAGDPADHELMGELVKMLLRWQDGSWAYPNDGSLRHLHQDRDLSISQFALLGLWAADRAGVEVPARAWNAALRASLGYQERAQRVKVEGTAGRTSSTVRDVAGFRYRWSAGGKPSGTMTTAGVACVAITRDRIGPRKRIPEADAAIGRGLGWLEANYTVTANPGGGADWHYYYLYGLERVAALCGVAYIGSHPWYLDGARELVRLQKSEGQWAHRHAEPDTCFALLFLKRATAAAITGLARKDPALWIAEDPEHEVGLRGHGGVDGKPLELWLTRVGAAGEDGHVTHPPLVERVEYLVDDSVIATLDGDLSRPWNGHRYPTRHEFVHASKVQVSARVHLLMPGATPSADPVRKVVVAPGFALDVQHVLEDWMIAAARTPESNLLRANLVTATADVSSTWNDKHGGSLAADQLEATGWRCAPNDKRPVLKLRLSRPVAATALVLHQAGGTARAAGEFDAIRRLEVWVKRTKKPIEVVVESDPQEPIRIPLPKGSRVRSIEIAIVERDAGTKNKGVAGINEVILVR